MDVAQQDSTTRDSAAAVERHRLFRRARPPDVPVHHAAHCHCALLHAMATPTRRRTTSMQQFISHLPLYNQTTIISFFTHLLTTRDLGIAVVLINYYGVLHLLHLYILEHNARRVTTPSLFSSSLFHPSKCFLSRDNSYILIKASQPANLPCFDPNTICRALQYGTVHQHIGHIRSGVIKSQAANAAIACMHACSIIYIYRKNTLQIKGYSLIDRPHLIPCPGPHTIFLAVIRRQPETIDMQSSPVWIDRRQIN